MPNHGKFYTIYSLFRSTLIVSIQSLIDLTIEFFFEEAEINLSMSKMTSLPKGIDSIQ